MGLSETIKLPDDTYHNKRNSRKFLFHNNKLLQILIVFVELEECQKQD
jgi:hypothetical protein